MEWDFATGFIVGLIAACVILVVLCFVFGDMD